MKRVEKTYDVVALGELLIDFTQNGVSEQGNSLFEACPGGAPCNVLAMLNHCGRRTGFLGKVGNDQFGRQLQGVLNTLGIDTGGLVFDDCVPTTLAFVHTLADGDRNFSFYRSPGADMMITEAELDEKMIRSTRVFHFGTLSMTDSPARETTMKALDMAKKAGAIVTFDPNYRPPLWRSPGEAMEAMKMGFRYCDMLKIADNELQFVTGKEDFDAGIQILQETYHIPLIFLTLGKQGSRAYCGDMRIERGGYRVRTIETTGAGDTFCGCVIDGILQYGLEGMDEDRLMSLLDRANAAAALITEKKGAIMSMPRSEEIEALMKRNQR